MLKKDIENNAQNAAASFLDTAYSTIRIVLKTASTANAKNAVVRSERKSRAYSYNLSGTFLGNNERR